MRHPSDAFNVSRHVMVSVIAKSHFAVISIHFAKRFQLRFANLL